MGTAYHNAVVCGKILSAAILGLSTPTTVCAIDLSCAICVTQAQQPPLSQCTESDVLNQMTDCLCTMTHAYSKQQPDASTQASPM